MSIHTQIQGFQYMDPILSATPPLPDDIYFLTFKLSRAKIPQTNSRWPFFDMLQALEDVFVHKERLPENTDAHYYIRVSTPHLTWYEAKTRELLIKYALDHLEYTSSWKVQDNESVPVDSPKNNLSFHFDEPYMKRITGEHALKIRKGETLLKTAHGFFQEQRTRNFPCKYDADTMPELVFDPHTVQLSHVERNIQHLYKSENMVFSDKAL